MYTTYLRKVGGSVMLAVPPAVLDMLHLQAGATVGLVATLGLWTAIQVRPVGQASRTPLTVTAQTVDAVRQWEFTPEYLNAQPIPSQMRLSFDFAIDGVERNVADFKLFGNSRMDFAQGVIACRAKAYEVCADSMRKAFNAERDGNDTLRAVLVNGELVDYVPRVYLAFALSEMSQCGEAKRTLDSIRRYISTWSRNPGTNFGLKPVVNELVKSVDIRCR